MSDNAANAVNAVTEPVGAMPAETQALQSIVTKFDAALGRLANASHIGKADASRPVFDIALRVLATAGGPAQLYERAGAIQASGIFANSDWDRPELLQPVAASSALDGPCPATAALELLSELRLLAIAQEDLDLPAVTDEHALHYLTQLLALKIDKIFLAPNEAERALGMQGKATRELLVFITEKIGFGEIFDHLIQEIERILGQRPIMVEDVRLMVTRIAVCLADPDVDVGASSRGADRLVSAIFGPTPASREDPGLDIYRERLAVLDNSALMQEARALARAMHDTGLVSPYHAVFLSTIARERRDLFEAALGLTARGREFLLSDFDLVSRLAERAVTPETPQVIYALAAMIESGVLAHPAVSPALCNHLSLELSETAVQSIGSGLLGASAEAILTGGVISVLGQPLGIGQGDNPTCQSARAISMWAIISPDYLLHLIEQAARDDKITTRFEGKDIDSSLLANGLAALPPSDVDPVSRLLVPHLDRIYTEMGRLCIGRNGDPHAWVNREMHGWWVGRETALAVDLATGKLHHHDEFLSLFFRLYDPRFNGGRPVIHPLPVGIAITDSHARFVGWHAISILRIQQAPSGEMRVYFFNPNNDGGQDWGEGVIVSTESNGERYGESSLPVDEFASRLYLFHYDFGDVDFREVRLEKDISIAGRLARSSWAIDR